MADPSAPATLPAAHVPSKHVRSTPTRKRNKAMSKASKIPLSEYIADCETLIKPSQSDLDDPTERWRLSPWADWGAWDQMRTLLHDNNHEAAQKLLTYFTLRRRSMVPIAMVSSVSLVSILNNPSSAEPHLRRMALAMALSRFVTCITDVLQPKGMDREAVSVATVANRLALPPVLVEIRHQSTHGQLPPLSTLEQSAREALLWLEANYWNPQVEALCAKGLLKQDASPLDSFFHDAEDLEHVFKHVSYETTLSSMSHDDRFERNLNLERSRNYPKSSLGIMYRCIDKNNLSNVRPKPQYAAAKVDVHGKANKRGIWGECKNRDAWRNAPIGLIPGQKRVPSVPVSHLSSSAGCSSRSTVVEAPKEILSENESGEFSDESNDESSVESFELDLGENDDDDYAADEALKELRVDHRAQPSAQPSESAPFEECFKEEIAAEFTRTRAILLMDPIFAKGADPSPKSQA